MDWIENQMDWNEYLSTWGVRLRSLAQGGLYYGEGGEADIPRYQRMQEIARELVEASEAVSDEQVAEMADARLEEGLENLYDVGRFEAVRELGAQMRDPDL